VKDKEIQFLLTLKDQLTAKWLGVTEQMKSSAKSMASTFQANWAAITVGWLAVEHIVHQGFEWMQEWAKEQTMKNAFNATLSSMGLNAEEEFARIEKAAAGLMTEGTLAQMSNKWIAMGMDIRQLADLIVVARSKAREMGLSASEAFENITTAIASGRQKMLKSMNISVDIKAAEKAYSDSLGITSGALDDVQKRQAILNAVLQSGKIALDGVATGTSTLNEDIQRMKVQAQEAKEFIGSLFARFVAYLEGVAFAGGAYLSRMLGFILTPFAAAEGLLRKFGVESTFITDLMNKSNDNANKLATSAATSFETVMQSTENFSKIMNDAGKIVKGSGNETGTATEKVDRLNAHLNDLQKTLKGMEIGTAPYIRTLSQIMLLQNQIKDATDAATKAATLQAWTGAADMGKLQAAGVMAWDKLKKKADEYFNSIRPGMVKSVDAVRGLTDEMVQDLNDKGEAWKGVMGNLASAMSDGFTAAFSGAAGAGKTFLRSVVLLAIDMVQGLLLASVAAMFTKGILTFGISLGADLALAAAATIALQAARAFVSEKFHSGGIVPKMGSSYVDAPASSERLVMVRGGETIRTEDQEAALRTGGGASITINVNGPGSSHQAFKEILQRGMREAGITDLAKWVRSDRSNLVLEA
jgi:hypothetical protein